MATASKKKSKKSAAVNVLNVAFVWDMSGSMGVVEEATKAGTLAYLQDLQKEETKLVEENGDGVYTRLSLTVFDTIFEPWVVNTPIADVDVAQMVARYHHRGGTALYDAIANTITETEGRMRTEGREEEKVLVIIMTDGGENSSQEYALRAGGRERLLKLIQGYEAKGNWTFVYLGANVDSYAEAGAIGIAVGNTGSYSPTGASVAAASAGYASMTSTLRSSKSGQTVTAFADAGLSSDYRETADGQVWTPPKREFDEHEKHYASSEDASKATRDAR